VIFPPLDFLARLAALPPSRAPPQLEIGDDRR